MGKRAHLIPVYNSSKCHEICGNEPCKARRQGTMLQTRGPSITKSSGGYQHDADITVVQQTARMSNCSSALSISMAVGCAEDVLIVMFDALIGRGCFILRDYLMALAKLAIRLHTYPTSIPGAMRDIAVAHAAVSVRQRRRYPFSPCPWI